VLEADYAHISNTADLYAHVAIYDKGGALKHEVMAITVINDRKNPSKNGMQVLSYGKNNKEFSVSTNWSLENINGVVYTCYYHDNFITYFFQGF